MINLFFAPDVRNLNFALFQISFCGRAAVINFFSRALMRNLNFAHFRPCEKKIMLVRNKNFMLVGSLPTSALVTYASSTDILFDDPL